MKSVLATIISKFKNKIYVKDNSGNKSYIGKNVQLIIDGEYITNLHGDISINVHGNTDLIKTSCGSIYSHGCSGDISSVSGKINIDNSTGNVKVQSMSGSISIKSANSVDKVSSMSGSITIGK